MLTNNVLERGFSEDIDITIDSKLSQGQMKKLKEVIKEISSILGFPFLILMRLVAVEVIIDIFWNINLYFLIQTMRFNQQC